MSLDQIATRLQERERRLRHSLSLEEALAFQAEGVRLQAALLEMREQLGQAWLAAAREASWLQSTGAVASPTPSRFLGSA
jgi:DNA-binding PucR family transcriptional regulator